MSEGLTISDNLLSLTRTYALPSFPSFIAEYMIVKDHVGLHSVLASFEVINTFFLAKGHHGVPVHFDRTFLSSY